MRAGFTGRHRVAVTLMELPGGILNSLNLAALAVLLIPRYVVCTEALTVARDSPRDLNYFNRSSRAA